MKKRENIIKLILIFLAFGILAGRAVYPESNLWTYLTPVGLGLILLMVHVFMPQLAGLPKDNPKIKTMRRINLLTMGVIFGLFLAHRFVPEKVYEDKDRFLLPFSVAVVLLVGNAAPKIPVNPVMGIRLPWTRRDPDTWRAAHRVLGYCTFPVAFLMAAGGMLIHPVIFSVGGLLLWALIPSVYSYIYHCRKR